MEHKIGEIFEYNGEWYQCIVGNGCENCAFNERKCYTVVDDDDPIGDCCADRRKDNKDVIFKKLEKVGEPFELLIDTNKKVLMQQYKIYGDMYIWENKGVLHTDCFNGIRIEIKQNKEDMEEKKVKLDKLVTDYTSNKITYNEFEKAVKELYADKEESKPSLKSFSLESAKAGKPVCTRSGRKARIIYFDAKGDYPIVALIETGNGEKVVQYMIDGHCTDIISQCCDDLMMLPEKKEGWVNVYKSGLLDTKSYPTKKEAFNKASPRDYVDTVKISWEE